jgi:hypothetical protein
MEFRLRRYAACPASLVAVIPGGATDGTVTVRDFSPCRTKELNFPDEELLLIYVPLLFSPVNVCAVLTLSL